MEAALKGRDVLIGRYGKSFDQEYGWASSILNTRRIKFADLEKLAELDHWRPRVKWASDDIHAGSKPPNASLGTAEVAPDRPVLLTGRSNSAFVDPIHMTIISLLLVNFTCPTRLMSDQDRALLVALRLLEKLIGEELQKLVDGVAAPESLVSR